MALKNLSFREWRLRFALEFAYRDLESNSEGDWLNLRDEILQFLGYNPLPDRPDFGLRHRPGELHLMGGEGGLDYKPDDYKALRQQVRALIGQQFGGPHEKERTYNVAIQGSNMDEPGLSLKIRMMRTGDETFFWIQGKNVAADFLQILLLTFASTSSARVVTCPDCDKPFYKIGKKRFCSQKCSNRYHFRKSYNAKKK